MQSVAILWNPAPVLWRVLKLTGRCEMCGAGMVAILYTKNRKQPVVEVCDMHTHVAGMKLSQD